MKMLEFLVERGIAIHYGSNDGGVRDKHISRSGEWAQMVCPLCGGRKLWLGYNIKYHFFNCYNHGHSSKWELFRAWFPADNPAVLLKEVDDDFVVIPEEKCQGKFLPPNPRYSLLESKAHCDYLRSRSLNPEWLDKVWGVRALRHDTEWQYQDRIYFPVMDGKGREASWLTRTILPDNSYRYLTAPKDRELFPIKSFLYGEQFVTHYDTVIVCEGVFDSLRIGRNAVATLGKKITDTQFDKIAQYQRRVLCFDAERDTQMQARELAKRLQAFPGITDNVCLDAPDPATASDAEIASLLRFCELI